MVNRIRAFRISRRNEKRGRLKSRNAYTNNKSPRRPRVASRHRRVFAQKSFVSRITCYFFFPFIFDLPDVLSLPHIRATTIARSFLLFLFPLPPLPIIFWLHERGARINFFSFCDFFTLSSVKFSRQTDNTDGSFRQKPRTSKSEKR